MPMESTGIGDAFRPAEVFRYQRLESWSGPLERRDGSKEWTSEWLPALEALGHRFGNDGQFIMECEQRILE